METLSAATLHNLLESSEPPCVSIVIPVARGAYDQRQARLDLKNLLAQARNEVEQQLRPHQTDALLGPAEALLDDSTPWPHGGGGIGLFLASKRSLVVHLPMAAAPRVMVGERFDVVPLLPMLLPDLQFHVLSVSRNSLKLYQASRYSMEEVHLPDLPTSLEDALWYERHENVLISHGGVRLGNSAQPTGVLHGGQAWADERRDMYSRYFQHIDRVLEPAIFASGSPMVLAAVEREVSGYRAISHHPNLCANAVVGNPEDVPDAALHAGAWEAVRPELQRKCGAVVHRFNELSGTPRRSVDVNEILDAACTGRVATMLLPEAAGTQPHPEPFIAGDADDLVNRAVIDTFSHHGDVILVPAAALPDGASMAAIFRWGEDV